MHPEAERNYPGVAGPGWAFSGWMEWTPGIFWDPVQKPKEALRGQQSPLLPPLLHSTNTAQVLV